MLAVDSSISRTLFSSSVAALAAFGGALATAQMIKRRTTKVEFRLPFWASDIDFTKVYRTDEEMMALAVDLSRRNVDNNTGGPFGSAIFKRLEDGTARLVSIGCNRVVPENNSLLHGETVAIQVAQSKLSCFSLRSAGNLELFTSCEPCCMCLGATLWSGVTRIVCAATKADAAAIGFDEGPVFEQSYTHLEEAGIQVVRGVLKEEAATVLQHYGKIGVIYNR